MTEEQKNSEQACEEDEINLLYYWWVIRKRQKLIIRVIIATVLATLLISLLMTNIYQAKAVITPITSKESGAGGGTLSALALQFGGLPGIVLPGGSSAAEIVNLLKSNVLREKVIVRYQLLPVLFYTQWDAEKKDWKRGGISLNPLVYVGKLAKTITGGESQGVMKKDTGFPDVWDGLRMLDSIVKVNQNIKENIIIITVDYYDPEMAAKMVEYFLTALTDHMSSEARRVATINQKYLEEQLGKTADPFIKQKIYNLIAQQLETSMMAEVKENFAFKVIDPPKVPDKKIKPKRTQMVLLSFVVFIFMGVFLAFFMEYLEKMKSKQRESQKT
jgi:uncharacterized protein involved in exopolysaccharide biosynthesis